MARKKVHSGEIYPDEILLDARNLPSFDKQQFEGQIEKPIRTYVPWALGGFCVLVLLLVGGRTAALQLFQGQALYDRSVKNSLRYDPEYAPRGIIYDRNKKEIVWNDTSRTYIALGGFGHLLGYVGYPREAELASKKYDPKELLGIDGIELAYNTDLEGVKGQKLVEVDALGRLQSEAVYMPPTAGKDLTLSIDSRLQHELYQSIKNVADERGFTGGAGVIMDVRTGELLAIASYPEYDSNVLSPHASSSPKLGSYFTDKRLPFLDRAVGGLYTPGSVVKPIIALAALEERIISPEKKILSTGEIRLKNPYNPKQDSVFKDWKAHGWVDMRQAIAVSSDVYFYEIGGGFTSQRGLGIEKINEYSRLFGLAEKTGIQLNGESQGTIPSPAWKAEHFKGEEWRIGDTYHTAIGQYGYQITPLQLARAIAAIANRGTLLTPQLIHASSTSPIVERKIGMSDDKFQVVHEGMHMATLFGTAAGLNVPYMNLAAKTGTAELGTLKAYVNSWVTGFFPYEHPRYAFAIVMEKGPRANTVGATAAMRQTLDWMHQNTPEYLE